MAFLLFAIVAAVTPGPSNVILTATGAAFGVRRGLRCLAGVAAGMGMMVFLVGIGLGSLILQSPVILPVVRWCGSAYLLWLAWKIVTAGHTEAHSKRVFVGFWQAAAFQWVNPKSWLITASAIGSFFPTGYGNPATTSSSFAVLFMLAAFPSCFLWLAFGAALQRFLRSDRATKAFNLAMGGLLASSIVLLFR